MAFDGDRGINETIEYAIIDGKMQIYYINEYYLLLISAN